MVDIIERFIKLQLQQSPESEIFLRRLIDRKLISLETMRNYCLVNQMDEYLKSNKGHIGHTLIDMSDDFGISERMVRIIHKKYTRIF
jgi:hypothetical protein